MTLRPLVSVALAAAVGIPSIGAQPGPSESPWLARSPGPRPTAAQVLDAAIPGRPASTPASEDPEPTGYAKERLYRVPSPGEHPRLLFSRADLPRIRAQLQASETGRRLVAEAAKRADPGPSDAWLARAYQALVAGDSAAFDAIWHAPQNRARTAGPGALGDPLTSLLFYRSLTALLNDQDGQGREAAGVIATYAAWQKPRIEAASRLPGAENHWLQVRAVMGDFGGLGFLYDFSHPYATPAQRELVREVIALCLRDRYGLGMDLPPHWRNWNFIGMGLYFPLMALSIEGEPGFDPRLVTRGREVARDYILHSNSAQGIGTEAIGYHSMGMAHLGVFGLALANRGDPLLTLARYRRLVDTGYLWALQPFGRNWASSGDLGTFPPHAALLQLHRFLYPEAPRVALVSGQAATVSRLDGPVPEFGLLQLLAPVDLGREAAADQPPAFPDGLPLWLHDPERGVLFTRTAWTADAVALQFNARNDTINSSHDHPDRGTFFLSAHGRAWTVPSMRDTESRFHSVVSIDGVGQGYFPTPARWLNASDSPAGTTASVDLSYCYNWRWMKSSYLADDDQLAAEPWLEWVRPARNRLLARVPRSRWERDPSTGVRAYYDGWLAGDPRMWGAEDGWVPRASWNPVQKAYRSIALVRGAAPFVIVADDIRKDDSPHRYDWRMILPADVDALSLRGPDLLLTGQTRSRSLDVNYKETTANFPADRTPRLLVRLLAPPEPEAQGHDEPDEPEAVLETLEFRKTDDTHQFAGRSFGLGKRLTVTRRAIEPRFRVLLFPHRGGDPLPVTTWESPEVLTVTTAGQSVKLAFRRAPDGSPRIEILR